MTLALDDFAKAENTCPTHIKIDVDGAEFDILRGAKSILSNKNCGKFSLRLTLKI